MDKRKVSELKLGKGPGILRGANANRKLADFLVKTATDAEIPYQLSITPNGTGTDANAIQISRAGVTTGLVDVPLRYMHTPCETIALSDADNCAELLARACANLKQEITGFRNEEHPSPQPPPHVPWRGGARAQVQRWNISGIRLPSPRNVGRGLGGGCFCPPYPPSFSRSAFRSRPRGGWPGSRLSRFIWRLVGAGERSCRFYCRGGVRVRSAHRRDVWMSKLGVVPYVMLSVIESGGFAIFGAIAAPLLFRLPTWARPILFAALYTVLEYGRSQGAVAFPGSFSPRRRFPVCRSCKLSP
jgi:hypothetical protein